MKREDEWTEAKEDIILAMQKSLQFREFTHYIWREGEGYYVVFITECSVMPSGLMQPAG